MEALQYKRIGREIAVAALFLYVVCGAAWAQETIVEDVTFPSGDTSLVGTLELPARKGPHPAVVLLTGSGPQDRDNAHPSLPNYRPFAEITKRLARQGVAVLRYDERGVGASSGNHSLATSYDLADDAEIALEYLRAHADIDPAQVGILGHSEGAWLAALVAARNENVSFVIALAGHAVPGAELLPVQAELGMRASGVPEDQIETVLADQLAEIHLIASQDWEPLEERVYQQTITMLNGLPVEQREAMGDLEATAQAQVEQAMIALKGWLHTFVTGDPAEAWEQVDVPVLAVFGALDTQVDVEQNQPVLEAALERAGNEDVSFLVLDRANHLFLEAESAGDDYASLSPELMPEVLDVIVDWLDERVD